MVTSAADLGDLQTKPNQIMHIHPYMIYLVKNEELEAPTEIIVNMSSVVYISSA